MTTANSLLQQDRLGVLREIPYSETHEGKLEHLLESIPEIDYIRGMCGMGEGSTWDQARLSLIIKGGIWTLGKTIGADLGILDISETLPIARLYPKLFVVSQFPRRKFQTAATAYDRLATGLKELRYDFRDLDPSEDSRTYIACSL